MAQDAISIEDLESQQDESERAKISLPESLILLMLSASADIFEIIGFLAFGAFPVGTILWILSIAYGLFVSIVLIFWAFLRSVYGRFIVQRLVKRKLIPLLIGFLFEAGTVTTLPARTISLAITIWLNNHFEENELQRIVGVLQKEGLE